jgi:transcription elongation factor/antiterminator RfaH
MQCYAVYTKPRQEDIVANSLRNAGIEVFNPQLKQKKYLKGSYRDIIGPLFPCYIFVRFDPITTAWMIRYTRGVRKIVGGDSPWPVSEEIIELINSQGENGIITIKPPELRSGDRVVIKEGPLQGLEGIFEKEMSGHDRVVLLLNAIEYQARIVIEKAFLTKAA